MKTSDSGKNAKFKYSLVALAVVGTAFLPSFASAQEEKTPDSETEVIEVKGLRGEWQNAQVLKQNADTVMDALTASDIGVLPDRSVLEAISRLPGVAMGRFAAPNDPDHFGTEGSGIVVRGLTHVRSEFNGRDTFTADAGRALSFQDVPPELMGSVEVYKNQTADMVVGGISGTVNLNTKKPFDSNKRLLAFSLDATYGDFVEETTPTFSGLYSDVFETDVGKFGLLVNYSNSTLKAQSDGVSAGRYNLQNNQINGQSIYAPSFPRLARKQDDREREGAAVVVQWENTDNTIVATGEYIRSNSNLTWVENVLEPAEVMSTSIRPLGDSQFEVTSDDLPNAFFRSGLMTSSDWLGNCGPRCPSGVKYVSVTRARGTENLVEDISFNVKYTPNDSWAFNYDVQYVNSESQVEDMSVMMGTYGVVDFNLDAENIPTVSFFNPAYTGGSELSSGTGHFVDPASYYYRSAMDHVSDNEGNLFATKLDAKYVLDEGFFSAIQVGARYSKREQITRQSTYNWNGLTPEWRGTDDIVWADSGAVPFDQVHLNDFARGGVLNVDGDLSLLFPASTLATNYRGVESNFTSINPDWRPLNQRGGATGDFIPNEINDTEEVNTAIYVRADFEGVAGGFDYSGNFGLRYVRLENETDGFLSFPDETPTGPDDAKNYLRSDQKAFGNNYSENTAQSSTFSKVLPSFNLTVDLNDGLLARVGISQALALPSLGFLRNYVSIQGREPVITRDADENVTGYEYTRYVASSGNPFLQPMEATNVDLTLEWYFSEVGSLTGALFYKDLKNYFINGIREQEFTNNGATQVVQVEGAINGGEGKIQGAEFAYQTFFDNLPGAWSGLGMKINYAYIDEKGSPNTGLAADHPSSSSAGDFAFTDLPLEGLSRHNFNFEGLYEKDAWQGRIAYNWRSSYLLTTRDVITTLPIFQENNGYLDASLFYKFEDSGISIGVQGQNLTDTVARTTMQIDNEGTRVGRAWFVNDRRFSFILRGVF